MFGKSLHKPADQYLSCVSQTHTHPQINTGNWAFKPGASLPFRFYRTVCLTMCSYLHALSLRIRRTSRGQYQDGGGIERGDLFLPHKFIKRSFECLATSIKQLLNTGKVHQAPRKADHFLRKEVGQNIKDKETKELRMETCPGEGVVKEEKSPNSRKPSHQRVCGEFWNLRGQLNQEGQKKKKPQKTHLT